MKELDDDFDVSITIIKNNIIVSLGGEMTDQQIAAIRDRVATKAYDITINGAILDFSMVTVIDTYTFKAFEEMTKVLLLMGVKSVWVGLRPGVVWALMDLTSNYNFANICAAVNLEQGLAMLSNHDFERSRRGRRGIG